VRGEFGQQVVKLKDETDRLITKVGHARRAETRHVLAVELDAPGGGLIERAHDVQERGFARTRGADDGDHFAAAYLEVDAFSTSIVRPPCS